MDALNAVRQEVRHEDFRGLSYARREPLAEITPWSNNSMNAWPHSRVFNTPKPLSSNWSSIIRKTNSRCTNGLGEMACTKTHATWCNEKKMFWSNEFTGIVRRRSWMKRCQHSRADRSRDPGNRWISGGSRGGPRSDRSSAKHHCSMSQVDFDVKK